MYLILSLVMLIAMMGFSFGLTGIKVAALLDVPSFLLIFLIVLPILLGAGVLKDVNHALRMLFTRKWDATLNELKHAEHGLHVLEISVVVAGCFEMLFSIIAVLSNVGQNGAMTMKIFCANMAVACIPIFYSIFLLLIIIPMKAIIQRHMIDYMEYKE